jgi:hypothetical protein
LKVIKKVNMSGVTKQLCNLDLNLFHMRVQFCRLNQCTAKICPVYYDTNFILTQIYCGRFDHATE